MKAPACFLRGQNEHDGDARVSRERRLNMPVCSAAPMEARAGSMRLCVRAASGRWYTLHSRGAGVDPGGGGGGAGGGGEHALRLSLVGQLLYSITRFTVPRVKS